MGEADWIGELRHKIVIEQVMEVQDENGVITEQWATFLEEQAQIQPLTGEEAFRGRQLDAVLDHRIRLRYRPGVRPKMRVRFQEPSGAVRYFDIRSVANLYYRSSRLELMCKELEVA